MITEYFLNSCFSLIFQKNDKIKVDKIVYRDILEILEFYKDKKIDIPIDVQNKYDCLATICRLRLEDKSCENIIDSLSVSDKYSTNLLNFIEAKMNEEVKDYVTLSNLNQIRIRKKLNEINRDYDKLYNTVDQIKTGNYDSLDNLILDYENLIKELYSNMVEANKMVYIESASSLDFAEDDFNPVIDMVKKRYERVNSIPTGFDVFDRDIFTSGGFEPSRLYVLAGGSGSGKSTLINNFMTNYVIQMKNRISEQRADGVEVDTSTKNVLIYITLENTIEEALLRIYQAMFHKTISQVLAEIQRDPDIIRNRIKNELDQANTTIIMKYFPSTTISCTDIMMVVDNVLSKYGKKSVKALFVDYLDLLRTDTKYDMYRLELGQITVSLKTLAIQYNIPVITPTQLNKQNYRVTSAAELNLDLVSESSKKIEHADCVILLVKDFLDENLVHGRVGKNRAGKANIGLEFEVNFATYKFVRGRYVVNRQRAGAANANPLLQFDDTNVF